MAHVTFHTASEDETIALGVALGRVLRAGDVLGLDGELGAGKTRLVRGIAEGLGLEPAQVSSPTYVLIHEYTALLGSGPAGGSQGGGGSAQSGENNRPSRFVETPLYHADAYRLSGPEELDSLGWERVMEGFGVVVIEWAERIAPALAEEPSLGRVRIQAEGENERRVDLVAPASWVHRRGWGGVAALAELPRSRDLPAGWARCPVTGDPVAPGSPCYPFSSERARLADLGRWLSGSYVVSRELRPEDEEERSDRSRPE